MRTAAVPRAFVRVLSGGAALGLWAGLAAGPVLLMQPAVAWADVADGGGDGGDAGDGGESKDDDTGCAHLASPVTGLSLLLGGALVFGLRRQRD
jgi:hypothetical protein